MATEAQLRANRLNAQKSTGPKSLEGKQKVRGNALTHGLTARTVHAPEHQDRINHRVRQWVRDTHPQNPTELGLITQAAEAELRFETAVAREQAVFAEFNHLALDRHSRDRQADVHALLADTRRPILARYAALWDLTYGLDWMIGQWLDLRAALDAHGTWSQPQLAHALQLAGYDPAALQTPTAPPLDQTTVHGQLAILDFALCPDRPYPEPVAAHLRPFPLTPTEARAALDRLLDHVLTELEARQQSLYATDDDPVVARACMSASLDAAQAAAIFLRYQKAAAQDMKRCLDQVVQLRTKLGSAAGVRNKPTAATPEPAATSSVTPASPRRPPAPPSAFGGPPPQPLEPINEAASMETPDIRYNPHDANLTTPVS